MRRLTTVGVEAMIDEQWNAALGDKQYDIFLSYSSDDIAEARKIRKELEDRDVTCFIAPERVQGGDLFAEKIRQGLLRSREMCVLYTENAVNSEWVKTEWGAAWAIGMTITPILLGITKDKLDDRLRQIHSVPRHELNEFISAVLIRRELSTRI